MLLPEFHKIVPHSFLPFVQIYAGCNKEWVTEVVDVELFLNFQASGKSSPTKTDFFVVLLNPAEEKRNICLNSS